MKAEDLYDSIGTVDEDLLERSEQRGKNKAETKLRRITPRMKVLIGVASVLIVGCIIGLVTGIFRKKPGDPRDPKNDSVLRKYVLAGASLPSTRMPMREDYADSEAGEKKYRADMESWESEYIERINLLVNYGNDQAYAAVDQFTAKSLKTFLSGRSGKNKAYSPINIYLMLGMLAESTDGNSRDQILSLAGVDNIENMRALSKALWNRLYGMTSTEPVSLEHPCGLMTDSTARTTRRRCRGWRPSIMLRHSVGRWAVIRTARRFVAG